MRVRLTATAAALMAVLSVQALGQTTSPFARGIDVVPIKPTPTAGSGLFLDGAKLPYPRSIHAALLLDVDGGVLALKYGAQNLGSLIPLRADAHVMAAYQLNEKLELAGDLPVTLYQMDNFQLLRDQGYDQPGVSAWGLGDLRGLARWQLADPEGAPIGLAAVGEVRANIGNEASFLGDRAMVFGARAAVERPLGRLRVLGNVGVLLRPFPGQFLNLWVRNQLTLGLGGSLRLPDFGPFHQVDGFAESSVFTPLEAPFTFLNADALPTPWDVVVGARTRISGPIHAELAVGRGVTIDGAYGREAFRVLFALRYELDLDVRDRDGDGIPDNQDLCPDQPEDKDGFEDSDGCPDPDNDHDGVADPDDQCPNDPGPKELDGCPDRDQDDVPDIVDKCPDQPGPAENEGCPTEEPQVVLEANRIRISENILFETASAVIQPKSFPLLDQVYKVLHDHPEVGPVRIEGHTDNRGGREYNLDLSKRRAQSVMNYLVKKGTDPKRLRFKGYGFDKPVATNATPLGRAKNRRVVFHILESGENEATQELEETGAQVEDHAPPEPKPDANKAPPPPPPPPPPQKTPKK